MAEIEIAAQGKAKAEVSQALIWFSFRRSFFFGGFFIAFACFRRFRVFVWFLLVLFNEQNVLMYNKTQTCFILLFSLLSFTLILQ